MRGCDYKARNLGVPMKLLDIPHPLVDEQKLGRQSTELSSFVGGCLGLLISLHRKVPLGHLMVLSPTCQDCRILPVPLNTSDRSSVMRKSRHGFLLLPKLRRSQIFTRPSSPPDTMKGSLGFQSMTLTSLACALACVSMHALLGSSRTSHTLSDLSQEQDTRTFASLGLHLTSSTLAVWEA